MSEQPKHNNSSSSTTFWRIVGWLRQLWRRIENLVFVLVAGLILCYFLLQSPFVQNWLIGKVTAFLSEKLQTTVRVEHVDIEFFDNLVLEGLYVADQKGDTLLYAGKLTAGLNSNIFSILSRRLEFTEIGLSHARFNIRRAEGEYDSNIQFILQNELFKSSGQSSPSQGPFNIRIQNFNLDDVIFLQNDYVKGRTIRADVPFGNFQINNLDLPSNIADFRSVTLRGLVFDFKDYQSHPLPPRPGAPVKVIKTSLTDSIKIRQPLRFRVGTFSLEGGQFAMDRFHVSPARETADNVMDFNHINVQSIDIQADSVKFDDDLIFTGHLRNLSAKEQCGFQLSHAEADRVVVSDTLTALYNTKIRTPYSTLGDTVMLHYKQYDDYNHFQSNVALDLRLKPGSQLYLGDIMYFSGALERNNFFINNRKVVADIAGQIYGTVGKKLRGQNLEIQLGPNAYMHGSFRGDGLSGVADERILEFKFDRLQSDLETIGRIIPGFSAPKYFYSLGNIGFSGDYQLFYGFSHILHGNLSTDIGSGTVDMNLDLKNGKESATYGGELNMNNFDLAKWTGSSDFGKTTFRVRIADQSSGLTLPTIKASVSGTIDTFFYKGYRYRNVVLDGAFREKIFDGKLGVKDPNIDFAFDGTIDMNTEVPRLRFKADLKRLDLGALNLLDKDWIISGNIENLDLNARNWSDLTGTVLLRNFQILQDHEKLHRIDSLRFTSMYRPDGSRYFTLLSDVADAYLEGDFNLTKVPKHLQQLFSRYHPEWGKRFGFPEADSSALTDHYEMRAQIKNSRDLTQLIAPDIDTLRNIYLKARVEAATGFTQLVVEVPQFRYSGIEVRDVSLNWYGLRDSASYDLRIPATILRKKQKLDLIRIGGMLTEDKLSFTIEAKDSAYFVENVSLNGNVSLYDSLWQVQFNSSHIALFKNEWAIADNNYLRFGNNYLEAYNFELFHENQRITVDSMNNGHGLALSLTNFDLGFINQITNNPDLKIKGKLYDFDIQIKKLLTLEGMSASLTTDTVFINNIPYGEMNGNIEMDDLDAPIWGKIFLTRDNKTVMRVAGAYLPTGDSIQEVPDLGLSIKPREFQTQVSAKGFPMSVLETFIPGISNTSGELDAEVMLGGPFKNVVMRGYADIRKGQFQLDYLKSVYHIRNQRVVLSEYQIWANGDTIWDASEYVNMAKIKGGLRHDHFRNWELECEIKSATDNFMILNTTAEDNAQYYGIGKGSVHAKFSGAFNRTNIVIDATAGRDSKMYIPISQGADASSDFFINFNNKDTLLGSKKPFKLTKSGELTGLNLEMNLTMTDAAEVQLIFDEQAGDIIKGRGDGDIKMVINREGEFNMYGSYRIKRGEYLFTLLNFVNKPFTVAEGGTINWYGDPYGAQINLDATYDENTSLYNLLRDEVALFETNTALANETAKATKVVVTMHLKGELLKPTITFDLDFPNISNQLKSFTDNKLRLLRQDQNELSRQVFGLVVMGAFLPTNSAAFAQSSDYVSSALHTVTQVFSNQFSNYLTELATQWFGSTVSSINFDIAYSDYQTSLSTVGQPNLKEFGRELQVRMSSGLFNDRINVQVGSQFGLGRPGTNVQDGFLGEDVTVEIQVTSNRQWRLKVYQRTEPDFSGGQRRSRIGFGISFRKEYDSLEDMMVSLGAFLRRKK